MGQDYQPAGGSSSPEHPDYSADNIFEQSVQLQPVRQPASGGWGAHPSEGTAPHRPALIRF